MLMNEIEIYGSNDSVNNAMLMRGEVKHNMFLTLTDRYVIHNLIKETKITVTDAVNKAKFKYVDSNGVEQESELKFICSVFSNNNVENNIFYNLIDKCLVNIPMVNELDADNLKNMKINIDYIVYDNYRYEKPSFRNVNANKENAKGTLSEPNSMVGKYVSVIIINSSGLEVKSNINNVGSMINDSYIERSVPTIELLAIKNSDLGLDNKTSLHTIVTPSTYVRYIMPVNNNNPEIIYIPLM